MVSLDGSYGEGGGQLVRTALSLSAITGKEFEIRGIRKGRSQPGLKAQHINCIEALRQLCSAHAEGAEQGSDFLRFIPSKISAKHLAVDIGTAGSIPLLLQCIALPMCLAGKKVTAEIKGGTDVKWSMSVDYLRKVVLPHYGALAKIEANVFSRGYYPAGEGKVEVTARPGLKAKERAEILEMPGTAAAGDGIVLMKRGKLVKIDGISHASMSLEKQRVAERKAIAAEMQLKRYGCPVNIRKEYSNSASPGSGITLWASFASDDEGKEIDADVPVVLGSDALGERGTPAENVGENAASRLISEIESSAPVDRHLADNMVPLLGIFGGRIRVSEITPHCASNIYVTEKFLGVKFGIEKNVEERNARGNVITVLPSESFS